MIKLANHIKRIEISSLWSGHKHIVWDLRPDVNVLSGHNGAGKSTILNRLIQHLRSVPTTGDIQGNTRFGVKMEFDPSDATGIHYDVIRSFDRKMLSSEPIGARDKAAIAANLKTRFLDIVDELFAETGKRIDRQSNELQFIQYDEKLPPYLLSSGEKQILLILLTVLTEDQQHYVLFMDEPEASLHFEWQKHLIGLVRELNPNAQIVLTTHSPALIMDGWEDAVTEVGDITV